MAKDFPDLQDLENLKKPTGNFPFFQLQLSLIERKKANSPKRTDNKAYRFTKLSNLRVKINNGTEAVGDQFEVRKTSNAGLYLPTLIPIYCDFQKNQLTNKSTLGAESASDEEDSKSTIETPIPIPLPFI